MKRSRLAAGSSARFCGSASSVQQRAGTIKGRVPVDTRGWYVLVTSSSGESVFAMLGPFATSEVAERKARASRVVHYRVESVVTSSARRRAAMRNEEARQMPFRRKSGQHHKNLRAAS